MIRNQGGSHDLAIAALRIAKASDFLAKAGLRSRLQVEPTRRFSWRRHVARRAA